jgi:hypothetical protein
MRFNKLSLSIGGWVFIATGIITLTIAFFVYRHAQNFVQSASRTQATITKLIERPGQNSSSVYFPVFRFQDANGQAHEIDSSSGQYPPAYKVGDTVTVLYQPQQPEKAKLDTFFDVWGWAAMLGGFGVLDLVVGSGMLVFVFITQRSNQQPLSAQAT